VHVQAAIDDGADRCPNHDEVLSADDDPFAEARIMVLEEFRTGRHACHQQAITCPGAAVAPSRKCRLVPPPFVRRLGNAGLKR
jgi:hypothetical protein